MSRLAAGVGLAGLGAHLVVLWWRRRVARDSLAAIESDALTNEDPCAICLCEPRYRCTTACDHSFCTDCFVAWWRQQPGPLADLSAARCPLCTRRVPHVAARFTRRELLEGGVGRASKLLLYNASAAEPLRALWAAARQWRVCSLVASLALYAANTVPWAMAELPPPYDTHMRLYAACHLLQARWGVPGAVLLMPDVRDQMHYLMSRVLLLFVSVARDARHARLVQDVDTLRAELLHMNAANLWCLVCKLGAWLALSQPFAEDWGMPLVLGYRLFQLCELGTDLAGMFLQLRLEVLGLRGLLMMISWRRRRGGQLLLSDGRELHFVLRALAIFGTTRT
ncbi:hypothetical protein AB1Y20_004702 [Prymnesium parvum]|uniref:RING-type domain-containing protein n=1 Tax=Prymnesium parvum TaxID=97485 RepID=A0AB34IXJ9_PRYPA